MTALTALWLPILVSAVLAFFASSLIWMVLPHHKKDYAPIPDEDEVLDALNRRGVGPGAYAFPYCENPNDLDPETVAKLEKGPRGLAWVGPPGQPNMGKLLGAWFVYLIVVEIFVAYLAAVTLEPGTHYLTVFRVVGTAALLGFSGSQASYAIWFGQPWSNTLKSIADGLVYALLSAGVFGWLWPGA